MTQLHSNLSAADTQREDPPRMIAQPALREAMASWLAAGRAVIGPRRVRTDLVQYQWLTSPDELVTSGFVKPANSIKAAVLPRDETLFTYRGNGKHLKFEPFELPTRPQIVLAARPCDAAALPILDHVFNWDYRDPLYNRRRELTTVISLACQQHDPYCFCTSVGLGPDSERGADAVLVPLEEEAWEVRIITPKGAALLESWTVDCDRRGTAGPGPDPQFDVTHICQKLGYDDDIPWAQLTLRCLGCGACGHNCPTCHCFDIVDQTRRDGGSRVRSWDSCQHAVYSLHASGHNPRPRQGQRQRNRVMHKYRTYPEKFRDVLCTGCGTCGRNCPVDLGVRSVLGEISRRIDSSTVSDEHSSQESCS